MASTRSTFSLMSLIRPASRITPKPSFTVSQRRLYSGDYGSGAGDPKGEKPQEQGSNPSAHLEHPGPEPVAEGQGTGGGPTKSGKGGHNTQENASSEGSERSSGSSGGAQPKIHSESQPKEHSEDVQKHNEEMGNRHGGPAQNRLHEDEDVRRKDEVHKGYWGGHGGADKQP
ncbi:MAG: hypothetical protein M1827_002756 [Pycnora praestabilis]|nr:MAG: hypothetical protein M1827_002756 [Pycnora praestabilis]